MYTAYRVCFDSDTKQIDVLNMQTLEHQLYNESEQIPEWMQRKIAVLRFMGSKVIGEDIEGVGCALSPDKYWLYDGKES